MTESRMLTYAQVGERLNLSVDTVRRYYAAAQLPYLKRRKFSRSKVLFTADSVERQVRAFEWNSAEAMSRVA